MPRCKNVSRTSQPATEDVEMEVVDHSEQFGAPFIIISLAEGKRFRSFKSFEVTCPRYIPWNLMKDINIDVELTEYLNVLGMHQFATMKFDCYEQLTLEFLVSFELNEKMNSKVNFRMLGTKYDVTLADMKAFFGFSTSGIKAKPSTFDTAKAWYKLTGYHNWDPKGTSSKFIQDPALFILQKYLAYTVCGKEQANKVNSTEVYLLWCAKKKKKVCISTFFWAAINSMIPRDTQHPSFAALASALAVKLGVISPDDSPPAGQTPVTQYYIDKSELKRAQIIYDDLSLFPAAKRACVHKFRLIQEANMRLTGEGSSRAQEKGTEVDAEEAQDREDEDAEEEIPVRQQLNTADWDSFRGYYDTSMGQFQQNIHQTFTDSMGGFQQTIIDSLGSFQQNFTSSMDQYRQEFTHQQEQFQSQFGTSMGAFQQELGEMRQDMGSFRHEFGDYQQAMNSRMDSQGERIAALEQSWNAWTLSHSHLPPTPTPPFEDAPDQ